MMDISVIITIVLAYIILHTVTITEYAKAEIRTPPQIELTRVDLTASHHAPPPRRPVVPVATDQETLLGDETIDDTDIDLDETPPPPPPPFKKVEKGDDDVFTVYDTRPLLKGGADFLKRNLKYPEAAQQAGIEGVALVRAVVDEKGNVVKAEVVKEDGNVGFGQAAIDFVLKCKFEPATFKNKPVKVAVTLPITFSKKNLL